MTQLTKTNRVIVYHDETKNVPREKLKGHVLLFVPEQLQIKEDSLLLGPSQDIYSPSEIFYKHMVKIREKYQCDRKFHFSEISGRKWTKHDQALFEVVSLTVEAMRTKGVNSVLKQPLAFKLAVIFYPKDADLTLYKGNTKQEKRLRHDETILRILLKGAAHYLYSDENRLQVLQIVCDGNPEHRPFSEERILWQLFVEEDRGRTPLRNYITIDPDATIEHLASNHKHHKSGSPEYIHANFLQVADLLLGTVRYIFFGDAQMVSGIPQVGELCDDKRSVMSYPVLKMLKKVERRSGFRYSGHYRTFTISLVEFCGDQIAFKSLTVNNIPVGNGSRTMQLLF